MHARVQVDTWERCYRAGWTGLCVEETMGHPAKFSRNLIQRIYQHVAEEGWLQPRDTVLDCFAGTGLGAYDCIRAGYRFVGIELEQHFNDIGSGCDCTGISKADWVRFYGRWQRMRYAEERYWCPQCLAQVGQVPGERKATKRTFYTRPRPGLYDEWTVGQMRSNLREGSMRWPAWQSLPALVPSLRLHFLDSALMARSWKDKDQTLAFTPLPFPDRRDQDRPGVVCKPRTCLRLSLRRLIAEVVGRFPPRGPIATSAIWGCGHARGIAGALIRGDSRELGKILGKRIVSSVRHRGRTNGSSRKTRSLPSNAKTIAIGYYVGKGYCGPYYGQHPAQLGNLSPGSVECAISSPPYANGCTHTGGRTRSRSISRWVAPVRGLWPGRRAVGESATRQRC